MLINSTVFSLLSGNIQSVYSLVTSIDQENGDSFREARADAGERGDFCGDCAADSGDAAEVAEQRLIARFTHAGAFVEQTLGDAALHENLVVAIRPAVGFVADALEQFQ